MKAEARVAVAAEAEASEAGASEAVVREAMAMGNAASEEMLVEAAKAKAKEASALKVEAREIKIKIKLNFTILHDTLNSKEERKKKMMYAGTRADVTDEATEAEASLTKEGTDEVMNVVRRAENEKGLNQNIPKNGTKLRRMSGSQLLSDCGSFMPWLSLKKFT